MSAARHDIGVGHRFMLPRLPLAVPRLRQRPCRQGRHAHDDGNDDQLDQSVPRPAVGPPALESSARTTARARDSFSNRRSARVLRARMAAARGDGHTALTGPDTGSSRILTRVPPSVAVSVKSTSALPRGPMPAANTRRLGSSFRTTVVRSRICRMPNPTLWWNCVPGSGQRASNQRIPVRIGAVDTG
jgi:hypothetical protein